MSTVGVRIRTRRRREWQASAVRGRLHLTGKKRCVCVCVGPEATGHLQSAQAITSTSHASTLGRGAPAPPVLQCRYPYNFSILDPPHSLLLLVPRALEGIQLHWVRLAPPTLPSLLRAPPIKPPPAPACLGRTRDSSSHATTSPSPVTHDDVPLHHHPHGLLPRRSNPASPALSGRPPHSCRLARSRHTFRRAAEEETAESGPRRDVQPHHGRGEAEGEWRGWLGCSEARVPCAETRRAHRPGSGSQESGGWSRVGYTAGRHSAE
jgi:hypothetical protein